MAGAIVNVAVAWGCVIRVPYFGVRLTQESSPERFAGKWARLALPGWLDKTPRESGGHAFGMRTYVAEAGEWYIRGTPGGTTSKYLVLERCAGWPLFGLGQVSRLDHANPGWVHDGRLRINVAIGQQPYFNLPFRPIWPGFAINTVFYAGLLWLLFAAPFALRKRRRIKRGLCVTCGYNLRNRPSDSSACPECGAPAPHAETSSTLLMQSAG